MGDIVSLYYVLLLLSAISVPFYIAIVFLLIKSHRRPPLNGSFFILTISTGFFDLMHLLPVWVIERSARFNWMGMTTAVMLAPITMSKFQTYLWWYSAFGQKLGILLTAINRLTVIVFNKEWKGMVMYLFLAAHWLLPFAFASPKLYLEFDYFYLNNSQGGVGVVQTTESVWQGYYCFSFCFCVGIICCVCYFWTFWKAKSMRLKMMPNGHSKDESTKRKQKAELKLAFMGFILALMATICGVYCLIIFSNTNPALSEILLPIGDVVLDVFAWIHPYLLLAFSPPVQKHFKILLRCGRYSQIDVSQKSVIIVHIAE